MPTIKTKKEMTLSELVEYGFNNPQKIRCKMFKPQSFDLFWNPANVRFSEDGCAVNVNGSVTDEDVYTVEVEEEITEDTVLPKAIAVFKHTTDLYTDRLFSKSINEILKLDDKVTSSDTKNYLCFEQ